MYNKNCYNACTDLRIRQKGKLKINATTRVHIHVHQFIGLFFLLREKNVNTKKVLGNAHPAICSTNFKTTASDICGTKLEPRKKNHVELVIVYSIEGVPESCG
jgi:hypothetical protein